MSVRSTPYRYVIINLLLLLSLLLLLLLLHLLLLLSAITSFNNVQYNKLIEMILRLKQYILVYKQSVMFDRKRIQAFLFY